MAKTGLCVWKIQTSQEMDCRDRCRKEIVERLGEDKAVALDEACFWLSPCSTWEKMFEFNKQGQGTSLKSLCLTRLSSSSKNLIILPFLYWMVALLPFSLNYFSAHRTAPPNDSRTLMEELKVLLEVRLKGSWDGRRSCFTTSTLWNFIHV